MSYSPGHSYVVRYHIEEEPIEESPDGLEPPDLPALPTLSDGDMSTVVGYTNVPQLGVALGNHIGYSVGSSRGMFTGRGRVEPTINFTLRLGSLDFLTHCVRDANDKLPALALYVGLPNQPSLVFRYAKCGQVQLNFQDSGGGGGGGQRRRRQRVDRAGAVHGGRDAKRRTFSAAQSHPTAGTGHPALVA